MGGLSGARDPEGRMLDLVSWVSDRPSVWSVIGSPGAGTLSTSVKALKEWAEYVICMKALVRAVVVIGLGRP